MKLYLLLLISSLITIIKSAQKQFCDCSPKVEKPSDCNDTFIKASEYDDCCYLEGKWKGKQTKTCIDLTPIRKDELESYIKELRIIMAMVTTPPPSNSLILEACSFAVSLEIRETTLTPIQGLMHMAETRVMRWVVLKRIA